MAIFLSLFLIAATCVVIWRACDGFETASEYLGRNLSEGVRGATINAIASSMPEFFTTLFFLFVLQDKDGFAGGIGTTAGSAVFNGVIIPSLVILTVIWAGIAKHVGVSRKIILRDGLALLFCDLVLITFLGGTSLSWWHGLVLMLLYFAYIFYMFASMRRSQGASPIEEEVEEEAETSSSSSSSGSFAQAIVQLDIEELVIGDQPLNPRNAWALLGLSTLIIGVSCFLLVHSCETLGDELGIPIYFIAVILASAATSVPDTIISIRDAQKGNYDDAVSNALGSNVFDVCFALGFPLFLYTMLYGDIQLSPATLSNVRELCILLFLVTLAAFLIFYSGRTMGRKKAVLLLSLYVIFTLYVLGRAVGNPIAAEIGTWMNGFYAYLPQF